MELVNRYFDSYSNIIFKVNRILTNLSKFKHFDTFLSLLMLKYQTIDVVIIVVVEFWQLMTEFPNFDI